MRNRRGYNLMAMVLSVAVLMFVGAYTIAVRQPDDPAEVALASAPPPPGSSPDGWPAPQPLPLALRTSRSIPSPIPVVGAQRLLVILADFPDQPGIYTGQQWQQFFFGASGFADYYREVSYNQLRYTGDVVGLSATLSTTTPVTNSNGIAYVRLPNPLTYYADSSYGFGGDFPRNSAGLVYHTLRTLGEAGFDFAPYANPLSHRLDNVIVVFAGSSYGYTHDSDRSLQATAFSLGFTPVVSYTAPGGQVIDNYTLCPEQRGSSAQASMATLGICAHEHGHGLGLLDLYDFSYTTSGAGLFDLMAYGLYGVSDGLRPFHPGAFSKEMAGWITPTVLTGGIHTVTLGPVETGANVIKLYANGDPASLEYFLLENRQPLGFERDWGSGLCPGLVIWHVDRGVVQTYPYAVNSLPVGSGGNTPPHQGVTVVEADGQNDLINPPPRYGKCGDTWGVGRMWNDGSTPAARLWNGSSAHLAVTVLAQEGLTLTLAVGVGPPAASLALPPGWNLVSLPVHPSNANADSLFSLVSPVVDSALTYTRSNCGPGQWRSYPASPLALTAGDGLWVHVAATQTVTLPIYGTPFSPAERALTLCPGWNLAGYPGSSAMLVSRATSSLTPTLSRIAGWVDGGWQRYNPTLSSYASDLRVAEPGRAYWLQITGTEPITWTLP